MLTDRSRRTVVAEPWTVEIDLKRTALLVIDLQHDFCSPGGWDAESGVDITACAEVVPCAAQLIDRARRASVRVVHTREGHKPDLSDCPSVKLERSRRIGAAIGDTGPHGRFLVRGSASNAIVERCAPLPGETIIDKSGKDAFLGTELHEALSQSRADTLLVCGVTTECCVHSTVRTASDLGYRCLVVADACASTDSAWHDAALEITAALFGWVTTGAAVASALDR